MNAPVPSTSNEAKVRDPQTGQEFVSSPEKWYDTVAAWISIVYLLGVLVFLAWLLFDIWIGQNSLLIAYPNKGSLGSPIFKLLAYTAIGGGLGGIVNGIRSFVGWHAERHAFGARFVWKYISLPPLGATLALLVYGLVRGGIAVFSGGFTGDASTIASLTAVSVGALAGYGSQQVFIWLDEQVNKLFAVTTMSVPDLSNRSQAEVVKILLDLKLKPGKITQELSDDAAKEGKVLRQSPVAESEVKIGDKVDFVIATKKPSA